MVYSLIKKMTRPEGLIEIKDFTPQRFIAEKIAEIREAVGDGVAITALSGGVDSSTVTVLGHQALGERLTAIFVDNGLMRAGEPETVVETFKSLGIPVRIVEAQDNFFAALKGVEDPERKREAITQTFYRDVFGPLFKESRATHLLQGTILTDVEETVAGIKRQHNVLAQIGIDPREFYGYQVLEPLVSLRKDGVRKVAQTLGLPESVYNRMPFPGPALATRIIGEVTLERVNLVRKATEIVEEGLAEVSAFQTMAILHQDRVTGIRNGQREFGHQIEIRCWSSKDAREAYPVNVPFALLRFVADRITAEIPGVVSVTYNLTPKPPSTMEAI